MVLVLTNSKDATANYLCPILEANGVPVIRLDTDWLTRRVQLEYHQNAARLRFESKWYNSEDFSHVWYRRPERLQDARLDGSAEGRYTLNEWAESLENFFAHIPRARWMNHPAANTFASHKAEQITTAEAIGLRVPETLVTQDAATLRAFVARHQGQIIVKPMATGYVERKPEEIDSLIYTNPVSADDLENLENLAACPTLFQEFIGRSFDVRITMVDDQFHAVAILAPAGTQRSKYDIRRDNMAAVSYQLIDLPTEVEKGLVRLRTHYALRFGAVDMAVTAQGHWVFFEINPNGQWAWLDQEAGTGIAKSFAQSFSSGSEHSYR